MKNRIQGIDLARACAIFGMVIVNFKIAMNADTGSSVLLTFSSLFEGRASALFVILAGIGITFLTDKARQSGIQSPISRSRTTLIKKGLFLIASGLAFIPIWAADILHFYGFYFLISAILFTRTDKSLLLAATMFIFGFPVLISIFSYEKNWNFHSLVYEHFWTLDGMLRHIILNGFHPVIPWVAFLILGMWLGRQNLADESVRKRLFILSACTFLVTEAGFYWLRYITDNGSLIGITPDEAEFLLSISIIPPLPQYMISASSSAVMVLMLCLWISDRFPDSSAIRMLHQTGKLSLTLYFAHVLVGMGILEAIGHLENQTIDFSLLSALTFCVLGVMFSVIWLRFYDSGPVEKIFRKLTG